LASLGLPIEALWPHLWATCRSCGLQLAVEQVAQADQVVGDHVQTKHRTDVLSAAHFELAQPAPLLDPAKHLLDTAAGVDRLGLALVAGGAAIDGGATRAAGVLRHVWCHCNAVTFRKGVTSGLPFRRIASRVAALVH